ncbi:rhodanese-like domain-containing protein [Thermoflavimicrobium dichotomicum]|uniref:Rhodanese-related sulfurtransferase n=1 Tax=Thermoflavimicrobium dichotomicum TaxID=46223 RepID=A0A1I3N823_9BACL|nr:rhodanese-like domain-containing protein [Thermoflavimicrobium dichotomicum]SFJ05352.1 Rhodanese-related sulfurtransferase [Thermoflavimicrobium dichotomicum]
MKNYQDIEAKELSEKYAKVKDDFVWVDVRTDEEYDEGHIPGSIHIPHDQMEKRYHELTPYQGKKLMLICRSGRRSVLACNVLAEKGFSELYNMKGGMLEWTGPIE